MWISFPFVYQTFAKTVKKVKEFIKPLSVSKKMEQDFENKERNPVSQNQQGHLYLFLVFFLLATQSDSSLSSLWNERLGLLKSSSQLRQAHTGINSPERSQLRTLLTCQGNIDSNFQYERGLNQNPILILTRADHKLPALVRNLLFN